MIIHDVEQRSDAWHALRLGRITGTGFSKVLNSGKGRGDYMMQLVAERLTGETEDFYMNSYMQWGIDHEDEAIQAYEDEKLCIVRTVGFVENNSDWIGVSPDGLVGKKGGVEAKCPKTTTHLNTILKNKLPSTYKPQVQGNIMVCELDWMDFISFDPRVKNHPLHIIRVERDDEYIDNLKSECDKFIKEMQELIKKIGV